MVALDVNKTSEALAVTGGYVTLIGLVSYFIKEKLFICQSGSLGEYRHLTLYS
jgi:hypothetical protein